jgi:hypothetical protein
MRHFRSVIHGNGNNVRRQHTRAMACRGVSARIAGFVAFGQAVAPFANFPGA